MDTVRIFAIIVAYNGMQWYDKCLGSLLSSDIPVRVIVVDNASTDGSADYIRRNYPEVILIESDKNLGFGKANNIAFKYAIREGFDYAFLLNQDAWVHESSLRELVELHRRYPEYGILSPMHVRKDGRSLYMQIIDGNMNNPNKELVSDLYCGTVKDIYKVAYVNAAAWLLSRETIDTIGGFDPVFNHYEEDVDYLNRARYHHVGVGICPSVPIVHDHHEPTCAVQSVQYGRRRHEQELLVELINPQNGRSLLSYMLRFLKKGILSSIRGTARGDNAFIPDFLYIGKNRKRISLSRRTNRKPQRSWLLDQ